MAIDKCRLCKSNNIKVIRDIQSPHFNLKYGLYQCFSCNSRFFDPYQHKVSYEEMYESFASDKNKHMLSADFKPDRNWLYQKHLLEQLSPKQLNSILDIGCRTGDFLTHFNNIEKVGVELSQQYSEICKERGITIYSDFVEKIDFKRQFDAVTSYALLEHLIDPIPVLDKIKESVAPGGIAVILVPWHECFKEKLLHKLGIQWHMHSPPEHLNFYSRKFLYNYFMKDDEFELAHEYFSSGGLFNPFKKIPVLNKAFSFFMFQMDKTPMNKLAIFDHLYLYFRKKP